MAEKRNSKKGKRPMEEQASSPNSAWRQSFNKLKHPSRFSKPQLLIFVLAFALIGYLIFKTFAAAPVVATLEGEQMTAQLASATSANNQVSQSNGAKVVFASTVKYTNVTLPSLSGTATVGSTLTVSNGTWSPAPTYYSYNWFRCNASGQNCTKSPTAANKNSYAIQPGDNGYTIRAQVAPNGKWGNSKDSLPSAVVTAVATSSYTNSVLPSITGPTAVGGTLVATNGTWTPTPTSYGYAWFLCDSTANSCSRSPTTANQNTYVIQAGDVGHTVVVQVAPNSLWSQSADSKPTAVVTSTSISFSIVNDTSASGGKAAKFGGGVKISGSVSLSAAGSSLTVTARADQCASWPQMIVSVDGSSYINTTVNSTSWNGYSANASLTSGNHTLSITNMGASGCSLYVDVTNFYGAASVPPPVPTVALSASPSSVTAGQSSTLTWVSTNATSCLASGAWSGNEPTNGSASTGALNQNSTYTLTCTGTGGAATASTTITVNSTGSGCTGPTNPQTDRLYSCSSVWNTPLPANVPIHPSSSTMVQGIAAAESPYNPFYMIGTDTKTDYPTSSTANVTVDLDFPSCGSKTFQVPITGKVTPWGSAARESRYVVLEPNGTEWDFWKMTSPGQTPLTSGCAANGHWHAVVVAKHPGSSTDPSGGWQGLGYCTGTLAQTGCTDSKATHVSLAAGEVRLRDMKTSYTSTSTWDHALAFNLHNNSIPTSNPWGVQFVKPAAASDGKCYTSSHVALPSNECLPEGAHVQLDPSIDCNTWPSLAGAAQWKLVECRTLQKYGAIIVDTGSGVDNDDSKDQFTGLLGFQSSDYLVPFDLVSHLRVVDWTKWTGTQ